MSRRLRLAVLGATGLLGVLFVLAPVGPSPAGAEGPTEVGWWNKVNGGITGGLPVAPPAAPPKVPLDPSAPNGAIQLAADASGPSAVGALRYDTVPDGATSTLVLKSSRPLPPAEFFALVLCTATTPWVGAQNGDWAQRPSWSSNCATPAVNGDTMTWNLDSSFIDGGLSAVLVPTASVAFQVTINPPDASSLSFEAPPAEDNGGEETTATTVSSPVVETPVVTTPIVTSPIVTTPVVSTPPVKPKPAVRRVPVVTQPASNVPLPFKDTTRGERIMAVSLLLGLMAAWWWVGGQPVRNPRLLGSVAGSPAVPAAAGLGAASEAADVQHVTTVARMGGVGRFAKLRTTAPRRL